MGTRIIKAKDPMERRILYLESLERRTLLSAVSGIAAPDYQIVSDDSSGSIQGYTPSQIRTAYGFNDISLTGGVAGTGAGQTIAIVDAYGDPNITSDLATFDSAFGLSAPPSFKIESETGSTTGLPSTDAGWDEEISLDVEWSHAVAPDASILLVEASSDNFSDLLSAVSEASDSLGVTVVSMSWGGTEFSGETSYDSYFTTPEGHKGVTYVAAAGDQGPWYGPNWPAISPNVISVGGTSLDLNSNNSIGSETAWSGSTGGVSDYEGEPGYQETAQQTASRTGPDVSYDADPNTGFAVYDSVPYEGYSGWQEIGGTSAGAPQWAGLIAIANQGRKAAGEAVMNSTRATLTDLYNVYSSSTEYNATFNDITEDAPGQFYYTAGVGYDAVTGLGSPKAPAVVSALVNGSDATPLFSRARSAPSGGATPIDEVKPLAIFATQNVITTLSVSVVAYAPARPVQLQITSLTGARGPTSSKAASTITGTNHEALAELSSPPSETWDFSFDQSISATSSMHLLNPASALPKVLPTGTNDSNAASFWSMALNNSDDQPVSSASRIWDMLAALVGAGFVARGLAKKKANGAGVPGFEPRVD